MTLEPVTVNPAYEKPYFTTIGMTDESCATVYGYASGTVSRAGLEDSEELEIVLADKEEVKRILKEEKVIMNCFTKKMKVVKSTRTSPVRYRFPHCH